MEDYMRGCTRKLALWYTRTFKPIMTHDELEPIMATLGFVGLPPSSSSSAATKEYVFSAAGGWRSKWAPPTEVPLPRPRLPYPRIDGLHIYTYRAFIDAVNCSLEMGDISDLFHVRGMPLHDLHRISDRNRKWRKMEEDDSVFVYREGTLDQATFNLYHSTNKNISNSTASNSGSSVTSNNSIVIREKGNNTPVSCIVPLKDIIVNIAAARDVEEWKTATATYSKETDGSIIIEGACGYGDLHRISYGKHNAGLSGILFNKGSTCGACYELRCVDHILWCLQGSPSVILTATDFCPPNFGLSADYGGWCNFPKEHFEMSEAAFGEIAKKKADIVPVQYRRVKCERNGGIRFMVGGSSHFYEVLITNVGLDGEVLAVKVKGSRTGWIPLARNCGQNWQSNVNLKGQPLSFEVTVSSGRTVTSYNVAPANWQFGQTFEGKQF
ncbi:unnamed protein product [Malus baccata var. baccata]